MNAREALERVEWQHLLLLLFVVAGLFLRLDDLGAAPFLVDETYNSWAAWNFLHGNGFSDPAGISSPYTRAWLTTSLPIALSFAVLGATEFAARLPSVFFGVLTIAAGYLLGKEIGGEKTGLIVAGLIALDPVLVTWSRIARMYAHTAFFYLSSLFLATRWYTRDGLEWRSRYLGALVVAGVLGYHTHILYASIAPVLAVFTGLLIAGRIRAGDELTPAIKKYGPPLAAFGAAGILYLAFNHIWLGGYAPAWYSDGVDRLFYLEWLGSHTYYLFLAGMGSVLALGRKKTWILPVAFWGPLAALSLLFSFQEPRFMVYLHPVMLVLSAVPLAYMVNSLESLSGENPLMGAAAVSVSVVVLASPVFSLDYDSGYGVLGPQPDHRGPAEYVLERKTGDEVLLSTSPFLTSWYAKGELDYSLNPYLHRNGTAPRIGVEGIDTTEKARQVMMNESGWIIAGPYLESRTTAEVREVVLENSRPAHAGELVTVYRFE